ncbi:MAG: hypothetical protein Q8P32_04350 [Candidatus Komeilibacteria bacterium]|nr:hypothetical protein [Candidatus Komeilibacteria bacterium]
MSDINLLPEDLREEDARQGNQAPSLGPKPTWHMPGSNGNGNSVPPVQPAVGQNKAQAATASPRVSSAERSAEASVLSVEPAGKAKIDFKPIVPIFDLDAEAKKSVLPEELSGPTPPQPSVRADVNNNGNGLVKPGNGQLPVKRSNGSGGSLLSRLLGKKEAKGRIIKNQLNKEARPNGFSKNVDVNLIPEGSDLLPNKHFYPYFIYAALGGLTLTGLLFLGLVLYQQKISEQEQAITAKVNESEMVYNQLKAKEAALSAWSKKVSAIQGLLDSHVYWTNFFANLQQVTTPDVYYKDINTAVDGTVTLSAVATSYLGAAKQYLAYQQADGIIKEVKISNLAGEQAAGEINFNVNLQFYPEVFFLTANTE